jgi:carboxyl-terminal processing protease
MRRGPAALLLTALVLASCGGSPPTQPQETPASDCTASGQVGFVRQAMRDIYYWYRQLPDPDPSTFATPEAYLEAVRYRTLDSHFSYITSKAANDAYYSESRFVGFGFSSKQTGELELRVAQSFPGGSAAEAGLDRGDYLESIAGRSVADLLRTGDLATALGPDQVGFSADFTWRSRGGEHHAATLTKRVVTIPTVSQTAVLGRVGYVHLRNFVTPSVAALDAAFTRLREAGASDLVLDLRYNGGGLVSVAQHLGGLIGGPALAGQVFVQFVHNDKNSARDTSLRLESLTPALGVSRLVVVTTRASASASEAMINGLRPYMDVEVVGDTTFGKPVGQYGFDFCDKVLYPVSFLVTNRRGEADYFSGIPADCAADDDLDRPLGSPEEASLAEALHVLRTGGCSHAAARGVRAQARLRARGVERWPADGWRQLVGAW